MTKLQILGVGVIAVAGIAVSVVIERKEQRAMEQRVDSQREQIKNLAALSGENEQLSNRLNKLGQVQPLSGPEQAELLKLRGQMAGLRREATEKPQLQQSNARLRAKAERSAKQLAEAQALPNYWAKDQLAFAGYGDPESTMKTLLWVMCSGNLGSWRDLCTPKAVAKMDNDWKRHGMSNADIEVEAKKMSEALTSRAAGFHIVDQRQTAPDNAVVSLSFDGEGAVRKFTLKKVGDQWKFQDLALAGQ